MTHPTDETRPTGASDHTTSEHRIIDEAWESLFPAPPTEEEVRDALYEWVRCEVRCARLEWLIEQRRSDIKVVGELYDEATAKVEAAMRSARREAAHCKVDDVDDVDNWSVQALFVEPVADALVTAGDARLDTHHFSQMGQWASDELDEALTDLRHAEADGRAAQQRYIRLRLDQEQGRASQKAREARKRAQ